MSDEILDRMTVVVSEVLERDSLELQADTVAGDVEGWDSLAHIEIIVAIEKAFKIRFTAKEIHSFKDMGTMAAAIAAKIRQ